RDVSVPRRVHRDAVAVAAGTTAQVGGVEERAPGGIQLGHKGVYAADQAGLDWVGGGEIGRAGPARDVSVARAVRRDAVALVRIDAAQVGCGAAQEGGVDKRTPGGIQLGHKGVGGTGGATANAGALDRVGGGEIDRVGPARDVSVARTVCRDAAARVLFAAAQGGGVDERAR